MLLSAAAAAAREEKGKLWGFTFFLIFHFLRGYCYNYNSNGLKASLEGKQMADVMGININFSGSS